MPDKLLQLNSESNKSKDMTEKNQSDKSNRAKYVFNYKSGVVKRPCSAINVYNVNKRYQGNKKMSGSVERSPGPKPKSVKPMKSYVSTSVSQNISTNFNKTVSKGKFDRVVLQNLNIQNTFQSQLSFLGTTKTPLCNAQPLMQNYDHVRSSSIFKVPSKLGSKHHSNAVSSIPLKAKRDS